MRLWVILVLASALAAEGFAQSKPAAPKASPAAAPAKGTATKPVPAKPTAAARAAPSRDEQSIFDSANRERATRQLPALKWNALLASAARLHAQKMAQAGAISHQFPGEMDMGMRLRVAGVRFTSAAENVAQGPTAAVIQQEWMNSPSHRDNILDPELDSLGVAVVARNGELFAVQDFALASP